MNIMFNGLDRLFELSNSRYGREAQEVLCFPKHHSLSFSLSLYIYIYVYIIYLNFRRLSLLPREELTIPSS
jgi:hypothetical protein